MMYALFVVILVALDQVVKYLVRANIPLGGSVDFIPGVMDFTYVQNTGAAFSALAEHTWLLTIISAVASVVLVVLLVRKFFRHRVGNVILSVVLAGAVGNLIDRALFGYVTDMFRTLFIDFPVFNVADICVTCGGIGLVVYVLLFQDKLEGGKGDEPDADPDDP